MKRSLFPLCVGAFLMGNVTLSPARADDSVCGPPPSLSTTANTTESVKGQLQGQADFLSKLVGKAELAGQVEAARNSIYQTSDTFFAAQKDAYLAYIFCVVVMGDKTLSTQDKLDAINKFKQPLGAEKAKVDAARQAKLNHLASYINDASTAQELFVTTDDVNEIKSFYGIWLNAVYTDLLQNFDASYAAQFRNAHNSTALSLVNHKIEGSNIYYAINAKLEVINKLMDDIRHAP